jgi:hypothetical protein
MKKFIMLSFLLSVLFVSCTPNQTNSIPQVDVFGEAIGGYTSSDAGACNAEGGTDEESTGGVAGQ